MPAPCVAAKNVTKSNRVLPWVCGTIFFKDSREINASDENDRFWHLESVRGFVSSVRTEPVTPRAFPAIDSEGGRVVEAYKAQNTYARLLGVIMKPKRISLWILVSIALIITASLVVVPTSRQAGPPEWPPEPIDTTNPTVTTTGDCSPIITDQGDVHIRCGPDLGQDITSGPGPNNEFCKLHPAFCKPCDGGDCADPSFNPPGPCIQIGVSGPCLDRSLFSGLEKAEYAFNAPQEMALAKPQTIALVIDTTGETDFEAELMALPGDRVQGETPVTLIMEAEIVGPAFAITPTGRQRRELSQLNPTRWDWEISPKRSGQHQLEVSLYVIATSAGESLGEEKALAERKVINVTVSRLDSMIAFTQKIDPLRAFIFTLIAGLAGLLAWFGIKSWKDVSGKEPEEEKPQRIEVTIKDSSDSSEHDETGKS